jgi:ATP-dependent helicase HrpB
MTRGPAAVGPETTEALVERARSNGLADLNWTAAARSLQARVGWARRTLGEDWPDVSDEALALTADAWLAPALARARRRADLTRVDPSKAIQAALAERRPELDRLLPATLDLPAGRTIPIDYTGDRPRAAVRVQDLFGTTRHPTVAGGRVPITIELLSPAGRPIQVTADVPGFWRGSWREVRREMAGRYPKHPWPEDPSVASPPPPRRRAP